MLQESFDKKDVLQAAEDFEQALPYSEENVRLVKEALQLYRQDAVYGVKAKSFFQAAAYVQDQEPVPSRVLVNLLHVSSGTCSCKDEGICRHIIAAFLYIYAHYQPIGTFVDLWKEKPAHLLFSDKQQASFSLETLEGWLSFFQVEFVRWEERTPARQQTMQSLYYGYLSAIKKQQPQKEELKGLYQIHTALATWKAMHTLIDKERVDPKRDFYSLNPYVEQLMDTILSSLSQMQAYALSFSLDPFLEKTTGVLRELLLKKRHFYYERVFIYEELWRSILNRPKWIKAEMAALEPVLEKDDYIEPDLGLLFLHILQKNDDLVLERVKGFKPAVFPFVLHWLAEITRRNEWKRLSKWYGQLGGIAEDYCGENLPYRELRSTVSDFFELLQKYTEQTADNKMFEHFCRKCLPYTFTEYSYFLFDNGRYTEWVEIHSMIGFSISELERDLLKEVGKSAPEALIPSYHREIAHLLRFRNRSVYKEAVRNLKKLKTLYKKAKRVEIWDQYIIRLSKQHKRLRAFQEELRKGKLIDG
ncbi:SWIM zinc finger family protein [Bacillus gobiensis]|uniref:SWIM zinc finger family protein n=1 Tax=Bacillus gobiensis TaxID=1441095 RepID=UPI003D1FEBC4